MERKERKEKTKLCKTIKNKMKIQRLGNTFHKAVREKNRKLTENPNICFAILLAKRIRKSLKNQPKINQKSVEIHEKSLPDVSLGGSGAPFGSQK